MKKKRIQKLPNMILSAAANVTIGDNKMKQTNKHTNSTIHLMQAADAAWRNEEPEFQRLVGRAAGRVGREGELRQCDGYRFTCSLT